MHVLDSVIVNMAIFTGRKSNIFGYMSNGDRVCKYTRNQINTVHLYKHENQRLKNSEDRETIVFELVYGVCV